MSNVKDPLVTAVDSLTKETTDLLVEYRNIKQGLTGDVNQAASSAKAASDQAGIAATQAVLAKDAATEATNQKTEATKQAVLAKASADKASQVSGLDTVAEAVQVALADSYQYAMTKADFDANREQNKEKYAGSGFVEWGKHYLNNANAQPINEGLWGYYSTSDTNQVRFGRGNSDAIGVSKTNFPVANIDGVSLEIYGIAQTSIEAANNNQIQFPTAPDGTKSYDSATGIVTDHLTYLDPKYDNTPAADHNEAVSRCFEGLCKNGDFRNNGSYWSEWAEASATYSEGIASVVYGGGGGGLWQDFSVTKGLEYEVTMTASNGNASASVALWDGGSFTTKIASVTVTNAGNYTFKGMATSSSMRVYLYGSEGITIGWSNISIRPVTSAPILTRQDLVFVESFHEDTSEKKVLLPLGNSQYYATTWNGIPLKKLTDLGVGQGYSAFGEWDKETVGYGALISELTDAQLKKFLQDPKNNIYFDAETGKLIQCRYRIRVIEGAGDKWGGYFAMSNSGNLLNNGQYVFAQGLSNIPSAHYHDTYSNYTEYVSPYVEVGKLTTRRFNNSLAYKDRVFAMPIALRQTLNSGAYHPVFNPSGTNRVWHISNVDYSVEWYHPQSQQIASTKTAFTKCGSESGKNYQGTIASNLTGRPESFPDQFYDAVYSHQIKDLRLSAHKQDVNKLRVDTERKGVAGDSRGWGKVPFTVCAVAKVYFNTSQSQYSADISNIFNLTVDDSVYIYKDGFLAKMFNIRDLTVGDIEVLEGVVPANNNYAECYVIHAHWLTPQTDTLAWTDLVGSPSDISATFKDGVQGMWVPQIPDGTGQTWEGSRKASNTAARNMWTEDNGVTWVEQSWNWDAVTNALTISFPANRVQLVQYPTLSNFTQPANNSKVVGEVGDVWAGISSFVRYGNRAIYSLVSKVATHRYGISSTNPVSDVGLIEYPNGTIYKSIEGVSHNKGTRSTGMWNYTEIDETNAAVKALSTITEKDGLLYMQYHGRELHYDATAGNWGDDSTIPIGNGEGTMTDDNGHTVKTFCHHGMIPLGIASYSDSSQSTK